MVMTWLEQEVHTRFTCCDHMACKTGQLGLCIDIYQYSYTLYFSRTLLFPSMSVFAASILGRDAFLLTPLCWVWARKGSRAGASAPPSWHCWGLRKLNTSQLRPLKCIPCLHLLVVILEKIFWVDAVPHTEHILSLSGGGQRGQSRAVNFCIETGHLFICQGSGYFVNGAIQDISTPDILVAKNKLKMLVKLYFGLPVPQIQGRCPYPSSLFLSLYI